MHCINDPGSVVGSKDPKMSMSDKDPHSVDVLLKGGWRRGGMSDNKQTYLISKLLVLEVGKGCVENLRM